MVRRRNPKMASSDQTSLHTLVDDPLPADPPPAAPEKTSAARRWILLAVASGGCAAFNGMFAKLTTTELTRSIAGGIGAALGLEGYPEAVEYIIRGLFFVLNLVFNGVMWSLYTAALASGKSTTQVSIMNTSTNFMITALLGVAVFSEALPPLWWAGAALLVAGNVILGRDAASDDGTGSDERGGEREGEEGEGDVTRGLLEGDESENER